MRQPAVYFADHIPGMIVGSQKELPDGRWVAARPEPFHYFGPRALAGRLRCAWAVFTGRADVLRWYGQ